MRCCSINPGHLNRSGPASRGVKARSAYFGAAHGLVETPVVGRADLASTGRQGPLIIEEYDTTVVVPPGWIARLDLRGNIHLHAGESP